jgi:hypothetical protein
MKTTVIGIVGGLLLVVAGAAGGDYAAKSTNPIFRVMYGRRPRCKGKESDLLAKRYGCSHVSGL